MDRRHDADPMSPNQADPRNATLHRGIKVRAGVSFDVVTEADPNEPISQTLAKRIFPPLCRPLIELVEALVPPGGRVLDLGSHIGTFALAAAATGRQVVAVEASLRNFELLSASHRANQFDNLTLVHAAISDRPGTLHFFSNGPFGHVAQGNNAGTVAVRAVAVDDLLEEIGWDRVDFIKIDIEGSEIASLLGMSKLLNGPSAPPLFVESNGHTLHFFNETPASLKAALIAYGYQLFQVEDRTLIPVTLDEFQATTTVDYLATKSAPSPSRDWRIDRPMPPRERIRRARASCLSPFDDERLYAARVIGTAPEAIRSDWRIVKAVETLKVDPKPEIRTAASTWSLTARPEPWYAFWRR
jgi:FkbM family methyltransferase